MKNPLVFKVIDRRDFVGRGCGVLAACLTVPLWTLLGGCVDGGKPKETGPLKVALAELPLNRRLRFEHGDRALEIVRTEKGVTARSLLCTHQGCNVRLISRTIFSGSCFGDIVHSLGPVIIPQSVH